MTENKYTRPHTAHTSILKTADDIFKSSIDGIKLFKLSHNPFLEDDDILDVDISNFKEFNSSSSLIRKENVNDNYDDDLDDLINQSMSDFNELKELNNEIKNDFHSNENKQNINQNKDRNKDSNKSNNSDIDCKIDINKYKDNDKYKNKKKSMSKPKKLSPTNLLNEIIKKKDSTTNTKISKLPPLKSIKK